MRVNVYAEEMTDRVELVTKTIDGHEFVAIRFYLELPVTVGSHPGELPSQHRSVEGQQVYPPINGKPAQVAGPFRHRPGDDDSSAVTLWGKRKLREVLHKALDLLDEHYDEADARQEGQADPAHARVLPTVWGEAQGARLRMLRERTGRSQADVAAICTEAFPTVPWTQSLVSRLESGQIVLRLKHCRALCMAYDVTLDELLVKP